MTLEDALAQFYIIRAQAELAIRILEGATPAGPVDPVAGCPHPDGHRHDASNAGEPERWICDVCDQIFAGPVP